MNELRSQFDGCEVRELSFSFEELQIGNDLVFEEMGYSKGNAPEHIAVALDTIKAEAGGRCQIRAGILEIPANDACIVKDVLICRGHHFSVGPRLTRQFSTFDRMNIVLATAGPEIEKLSRQMMQGEDPVTGYIVDALGSAVACMTGEKVLALIDSEIAINGMITTPIYSPGYCDWPVSDQQKLFALLPPGFLDVRLSESSLMYPIKSISGFAGIGTYAKKPHYQCAICTKKDCYKRRAVSV